MWVHTYDGQQVRLTASIFEHLFKDKTPESSLCSYRLAIETLVIDINISYCRSPRVGFAVIVKQDRMGLGKHSNVELNLLVWPVSITPDAKEGSALHRLICTNTFQCATMFGHYRIVLCTQYGVSERIGIVDLDAEGCVPDERFWGPGLTKHI